MPTSTYFTLVIIYTLEAVLIVFGNAFTIFVFWTKRSRLKRTYFLLINLAVADRCRFTCGVYGTFNHWNS